ncbi:Sister chromatid cohesion 1 protein 2 [Vitis vinifera]|uniref:Sister chromatid cohesion 1 protein 2 n=1 Tax=Vitis vinifera TaxID=29760 RepID=A0A438H7B3_VITVI|nr:Sister chromatid cohesion 1 protein 2 [Vitis vinifera]
MLLAKEEQRAVNSGDNGNANDGKRCRDGGEAVVLVMEIYLWLNDASATPVLSTLRRLGWWIYGRFRKGGIFGIRASLGTFNNWELDIVETFFSKLLEKVPWNLGGQSPFQQTLFGIHGSCQEQAFFLGKLGGVSLRVRVVCCGFSAEAFPLDKILVDEVPVLAYRILGYILLGVVRIYSKKVEYLFDDCQKMLIKVKDFAVGKQFNADMEGFSAPCFSITLPKTFELDAFDLEVLEDVSGGNVRPQEEITLQDTLKNEGIRHYFLDQVFCLKLFVFIEVIMWPSFQHVKNHSECKNFYFIELNML